MVEPLAVRLDGAKSAFSVDGGPLNRLKEEFAGSVVGAAEGCDLAIVIEHLQSAEVDFLVSAHRVFNRFLVSREGWRIENDEIVSFLVSPKEIEGVGGNRFDFHSGEFGVPLGRGGGFFGNVDCKHGFRPGFHAGEAEAALVAENVEDFLALCQLGHAGITVHDVKEEACFLAVGGINFEDGSLMLDREGLGLATVEHSDFIF